MATFVRKSCEQKPGTPRSRAFLSAPRSGHPVLERRASRPLPPLQQHARFLGNLLAVLKPLHDPRLVDPQDTRHHLLTRPRPLHQLLDALLPERCDAGYVKQGAAHSFPPCQGLILLPPPYYHGTRKRAAAPYNKWCSSPSCTGGARLSKTPPSPHPVGPLQLP